MKETDSVSEPFLQVEAFFGFTTFNWRRIG